MTPPLDAETMRLIHAAVADAPLLTTTQIADLRRIMRPDQWVNQPPVSGGRVELGRAA